MSELPTDAVIVSIAILSLADADEVNKSLPVAYLGGNVPEFRIIVPDHDGLSVLQHSNDVWDHQLGYVRYTVQYEITVGADQGGKVYVSVIDTEVVSFSDQPLYELDDRALPQVVGPCLEAEA